MVTTHRAALLVVAACGSAPPPKPIDNAVPVRARDQVVVVEWNVLDTGADATIGLRVGAEIVQFGTYPGGVFPAWQSYCERKGGTDERNLDVARRHGAFAKLTVTPVRADAHDPTPAGATTFLIKRPSRGLLEVWQLGTVKPRAAIQIDPAARVEERIKPVGADRFACGDANLIDI